MSALHSLKGDIWKGALNYNYERRKSLCLRKCFSFKDKIKS